MPAATAPDEIAYYICYGPADTRLDELVRVAGSRWAIEECFQTAKNETGLDHYQVRVIPHGIGTSRCRWLRPRS